MDQLKELEQVQNVMLMIQSVGAIDSSNNTNADSDRFLANFILFMMQPCGELNISRKCKLISDHFPKISCAFLEEASHQLFDKGNGGIEDFLSHQFGDEKGVGLSQTDCENVAMVSLESMQQANSTLQDFCRSYFMFHEMDANSAESIFKYLPLLCFTESYIYQLDTINEKLLQLPFVKSFGTDMFRPLSLILERHGILTDRIRHEMKCGVEYWALERKLCCALTNKQEIQVEDAIKAIHLKSFDYRVLNLLLYQLNGKQINEMHMEFLSLSEFLVEVSDDLETLKRVFDPACCRFDYEGDVMENNFNILRMFVRIYGASKAPSLLAKSITEAEEKYNCLLNALDPKLALQYQKRCEEATKEGGKLVGPPLGTWCMPPIIEDEDLYRYQVSNTKTPLT